MFSSLFGHQLHFSAFAIVSKFTKDRRNKRNRIGVNPPAHVLKAMLGIPLQPVDFVMSRSWSARLLTENNETNIREYWCAQLTERVRVLHNTVNT